MNLKINHQILNELNELKDILKHLWVTMNIAYFEDLADSMPQRLKNLIQAKGCMTKYYTVYQNFSAVNKFFFK